MSARDNEPEAAASIDEEQQALVEPLGNAAGSAVGAVSERAGEAVREDLLEGERETTPLTIFGGVTVVLGAVLLVVITAVLLLFYALGGR